MSRIPWLALLTSIAFAQTPALTSVQNAASYWAPGLPGSGIARGSMFVLKGSNLGPATIVIADAFPLTTTLAETSVRILIGGQSFDAIMYYSLSRQVAAILPSNTPAGFGTVTLTYRGVTSAPLTIGVTSSAPGLYTRSETGNGLAVATHADYGLVTPERSAQPGEIIVLWANGLGPITGDDTRPPAIGNLTDVPLEVFIGGKLARVSYRGRNPCCPSLDQINVEIPQGVEGCYASIVLQVGGFTSGSAGIPVAASRGVCPPTRSALSTSDVSRLLAKGNTNVNASVSLGRTINRDFSGRVTRTESGTGIFRRTTAPAHLQVASSIDMPTFGSCDLTSYVDINTYNPLGIFTIQTLDAGPSISVSGPVGSRSLLKQAVSGTRYSDTFPTTSLGGYINAGTYNLTAEGGPEVGAWQAAVSLTEFSWTNRNSVVDVERNRGVTVTWSTNNRSGVVIIGGIAAVGLTANSAAVAQFVCYARPEEGTFTVPPTVLQALPAVARFSGFGSLRVGFISEVGFSATGLDWGIAQVIMTDSDTGAGYR